MINRWCAAALALGVLCSADTAVRAGDGVTVEATAGGQVTSTEGERDAKFFEYRDPSQGAVIEHLRVFSNTGSPWYFVLDGANVSRGDQRYVLEFGRAGVFRMRAGYDETPQFLYNDATWLLAGEDGRYTFDNAFRQVIETASTDPLAPEPVTELMPRVLDTTARPLDLGTERQTGFVDGSVRVASWFDLGFEASREKKAGLRRISTGTYIRRQAVAGDPTSGPGFFDRERFESRGLELPEAVEYRVNQLGLTTTFRAGRGVINAGVQSSAFENQIDQLYWDNPFEAAPSVSSSSTGIVIGPVGQQEPAGFGTTNNRGRAAQNALDLWPSNDYLRYFVTASYPLPLRSRITAQYSQGTTEQDDAFLPYTLNEAVIFDVGPDGTANTADDILARDAELPARDLDGEIVTTTAALRLISRPLDPLALRATWRRYEYENNSRELFFPGYAAAGESYMRRDIGRPLINDVGGYQRTQWALGGSWRFGRPATIDVEYGQQDWEYDHRQVEGTTETTLAARLRVEPVDWLAARLTYSDSTREFEGEYEIGLETSRIRMYDVWDRDRQAYSVEVDVTPGDAWTFGAGYGRREDEYPGVVPEPEPLPGSNPFPSYPYGLNAAENESVWALIGFARERYTVQATVGHDSDSWDSLHATKTSLANDAIQYDPQNRWRRLQDDGTTWGNLFLGLDLLPNKARLTVDLTYSDYGGDLETTNLETPTINSAVAYDYPELNTKLFTARVALDWVFTRNLTLSANYWYEPFRLDDFAWDVLQPYMQGRLLETGDAPGDVRPMNVNRLLWLDARYSDYTAHVASLLLHMKF